jgi:L-lactate dehydrogenase complex protein LldG
MTDKGKDAGRDAVMGAVRRALRRGGSDDGAAVAARLAERPRGPVPARAQLDREARLDLFEKMAGEVAAKVVRLSDMDAVPEAVGSYLKSENLPAELRLAPDPELTALPWERQPTLTLSEGPARPDDAVSLTGAFAGVAETGSLMLCSGAAGPTTLNFLPETHIVVLRASRMVGPYEEAWDRLRESCGSAGLPRTVNFVTGPSRTADIEQTIQMGAHGPRRLCILLVDDGAGDAGPQD